jgi:cell shape-determining protein MreD
MKGYIMKNLVTTIIVLLLLLAVFCFIVYAVPYMVGWAAEKVLRFFVIALILGVLWNVGLSKIGRALHDDFLFIERR